MIYHHHQPEGDSFADGAKLLVVQKLKEALRGPCPGALGHLKSRMSIQRWPTTPSLSLDACCLLRAGVGSRRKEENQGVTPIQWSPPWGWGTREFCVPGSQRGMEGGMDGAARVTRLSFAWFALSCGRTAGEAAWLHLSCRHLPMSSSTFVGSGVAQEVQDPPSFLLLLPLLSLEMLQEHVSWRSTRKLWLTSALSKTYHLPWQDLFFPRTAGP